MWSAAGPDKINYAIWRKCTCLLGILCDLLSRIETDYPKSWKEGDMIFIYKKGPVNNGNSFRTITLTSALSKIYTSILSEEIMKHLKENNYLAFSQKGFLPGVSGCLEHQFTLQEILKKVNKKSSCICVFSDIKAAYGSVNHEMVEAMLRHYHIPEKYTKIIMNMYRGLNVTI